MFSNEMHWKQYHKWSHLDRTEKCNVLTWNLNENIFDIFMMDLYISVSARSQ